MFVAKKIKGEMRSLPAKELDKKRVRSLGSDLAQKILKEISKGPVYPKAIAKRLKVNEQKVYYHIRNLEKAKVIEVARSDNIQGTIANFYSLVEPAFVIRLGEFEKASVMPETEDAGTSLEPFVDNGKLNATIIVGSPDPHGPEKARSRDGYYGIDFALFLGTFLNFVPNLNVRLDTEAREEDLKDNLILIGGPVVNTITDRINLKLPIWFDKENNWNIVSTLSEKSYHSDETGVVEKIKNPFNPKKFILLVAGKRHAGTRSVMIAFMRHFKELFEGNKYNKKMLARVIEGIDMDSDGIVDEVEFLE